MSTALYESVARIARHEVGRRAVASAAVVTALFTTEGATPDHAVTVRLRESGLVLPRVPVAVGLMGAAAIPNVGDLVVVLFLDGDVNAPVVVSRLYHGDLDPPEHAEGQAVLRLPSGTGEPGFNLEVSTTEPQAVLELPGEVRVEVADGKVVAEVGALKLSVDSAGGGRAEVAAGGSSIVLKKDGDVTVKAATKLSLEAAEVVVKGSAKVTITGAVVEIN